MCGVYSLQGKITPIAEISSGGSSSASQSKCEIKEVFPTKIYKSESDTKNGQEYFIN